MQDVGSLLPEAAVRELAAREFQAVETGGRARVYVRSMAGASAADLTDAVLAAFHDIIGEEPEIRAVSAGVRLSRRCGVGLGLTFENARRLS